jgi:hypothetical protein
MLNDLFAVAVLILFIAVPIVSVCMQIRALGHHAESKAQLDGGPRVQITEQ